MPAVRTTMSKKNKGTLPQTLTTTPSLSIIEIIGLLDCYNFLSPHEYSDKTIGLLAFLLRKRVGDINFSDIFDKAEEYDDQKGQSTNFVTLLKKKREDLHEIEASIEKCLMLNRLITYIEKNEARFTTILSDIRLDMKAKMIDNQIGRPIEYPKDFQQRETDSAKRKYAQEIRRLFYFSHRELEQPINLISLQNRITDHLNCLIDEKMKFRSEFYNIGPSEMINIFGNSFMIIDQPHSGVNPVLIYEKKGPGLYTAKVSVIIVSLLHDFIETHSNLIQLYDIEPSLCPPSPLYKLEEPRSISWKTCHLKACPGIKPRMIQYAELPFITIQQTCPEDKQVYFAQALHSLKFIVRFRVNLKDTRCSQIYQIELESLPFAIGHHTNQIPPLLTRVILNDIKRFSKSQTPDVKRIKYFILRYFIHRTGVEPNEYVKTFLDQELNKALNKRKDFQTLEDIYMDFLVPFVHQVEFMGKHPIFAMSYADKFFFGPCNNEATTEVMKNSSNIDAHKFLLRFSSIRVDYKAIAGKPVWSRIIKLNSCDVRIDIYNNCTKETKPYTLDSTTLFNDLSKLVSTAHSDNNSGIHILSDIDEKTNDRTYKPFTEVSDYYHDRLYEISKTNEKYHPLSNIINNVVDQDSQEIRNTVFNGLRTLTSRSLTSNSSATVDNEQNVDTNHVHHHGPAPDDNQTSSQNILSLSNEEFIRRILSQPELVEFVRRVRLQPELLEEIAGQMTMLNLTIPTQQQQASVVIDLDQTNNETQSECCLMNEIISSDEEDLTQVEVLQTDEDMTDLIELITTNQMPEPSNIQDLELSLDELTTYVISPENGQYIITDS